MCGARDVSAPALSHRYAVGLPRQGGGILTHPSRWSAAALAGCTTLSNYALLCVIEGNVASIECRGTSCNVATVAIWGGM